MLKDALETERLRQLELGMQRTLEKTRGDVRRRHRFDILRMPDRCRLPSVAGGVVKPKRRRRTEVEDDDDDDDDDEDDKADNDDESDEL